MTVGVADVELSIGASAMTAGTATPKRSRKITEVTAAFRGWKARFADFDEHDHILAQMRSGRFYEDDLLNGVFHALKPGCQIVDVGACIGTFTVFCGLVLGASVTAIEPDKRNLRQLRSNVRRNALNERTKLVHAGIGEGKGKRAVIQTIAGNAGAKQLRDPDDSDDETITLRSLNSVWPKARVDLLKVDTEGMELEVLASGRDALSRDKPIIVVECADDDALRRTDAFMGELGYAFDSRYCYTPTLMYRPVLHL